MPAARIGTFDDWVDLFRVWRNDIGVNYPEIENYQFEAKFGPTRSNEIEFGAFKGRPKWRRVLEIPDQRIRDGLLNLIVYQGDTEFASVEQQRRLFEHSPSEHDRQSLCRVVTEEMRHGWQMCHLLINHFGYGGKVEAQKMLERRAFESKRLLGAFNQIVDNWLDFFTYTDFVDRDGKFQLTMLSYSGFEPLAQSMNPMLREESFHLGTGHDGLKRIVKAGVVPMNIVQKYVNKWIPVSYDLFGVDSIQLRSLVLRVGVEGPLRRSADAGSSRPRPYERAQSQSLPPGMREADRANQQACAGRTDEAVRAVVEIQPAHRRVCEPTFQRHRRVAFARSICDALQGDAAAARGHQTGERNSGHGTEMGGAEREHGLT